jgi:hypothetical protein
MLFETGAIAVANEQELVGRASLLSSELGMAEPHLAQFQSGIAEDLGPDGMAAWLSAAQSRVGLELIRRFAEIEGDIRNPGLKGLGRVSQAAFPRMGGALNKQAAKAGVDPRDVVNAVERSVQASYLAMLIASASILDRALTTEAEQVWQRWIPQAYAVPDEIVSRVSDFCAFVEFWRRAFLEWGMKKAAKELSKRSPVSSSLGGLMGVGAALAIAEREPATER